MVSSLVYRTDDGTRWGGGQGSDLAAQTIDRNFWTLFSAIQALESNHNIFAGIDYVSQPLNGNTFYIHLTDHRVLGPFTLPTAQWKPRGNWAPITAYSAFDVVSDNGGAYLVTSPHTSAATFSPFATDGIGQLLYVLVLSSPSNMIPNGGTTGQRLAKSTGSPYATEWISDFIRLAVFVEGQPTPSEVLMQYPVVDHMTFPAGLVGSVAFDNVPCAGPVSYTLAKNGAAIGSIDFHGPSPSTVSVSFSARVACVPGDVITLVGPSVIDATQAGISFTLVAELT